MFNINRTHKTKEEYMKQSLRNLVGGTITLLFVALFGVTAAHAATVPVNEPVTAASQVAITNITAAVSGNSVRVQFDYALVNGATTAVVDAALNDQFSFGQVTVTGPGHFDETLSNLNSNTYTLYVISTGNNDYLIPNTTLVVGTPTPPANNNCNFFAQLLKYVSQYFKQYWF
jgi:hypothetical protein